VKLDKRVLAVTIAAICLVAGVAGWLLLAQQSGPTPWNRLFSYSTGASDSTEYGEFLEIHVSAGGATSQASWRAAAASTSQDVYTVDNTYYDQQKITLKLTITITYQNVENIVVDAWMKGIDTADNSYYQYNLASSYSWTLTSGSSKDFSVTKSISQFLTDIGASTTDATVKYTFYVKVTATGSISGKTLTAEIAEQDVTDANGNTIQNHFVLHTESASSNVTPDVSFSSWVASWAGITTTALVLVIGVVVGYVIAKLNVLEIRISKPRRKRGR